MWKHVESRDPATTSYAFDIFRLRSMLVLCMHGLLQESGQTLPANIMTTVTRANFFLRLLTNQAMSLPAYSTRTQQRGLKMCKGWLLT